MRPPPPNRYRDHWCGELRAGDAGATVRVAGWVHRRRDHGGLIFIDLRDRSGLLQLVLHPDSAPAAHAAAHELRSEAVLSVAGTVVGREPVNVNAGLATGDVELAVAELDVLATSPTPPFPIDEDVPVDETLRLRHRPLDLRREPLRDALILRHRVTHEIRTVLERHDFLEIETPILTRATPEGARDFLVPSRLQPGSFYALPQSPQIFKQLLMIGGLERYYQIARCFRDEDQRADRQPEFTQLDLEMAFVTAEEVITVTEAVMSAVFAVGGFALPPPPWPRMCFAEAIGRFGSDRPDRRFGLELRDVGEHLRGSQFRVFESVLGRGGAVWAINAGSRSLSRSDLDGLSEFVKRYGAAAVAPIPVGAGGEWGGNLAKFFSAEQAAATTAALDAHDGDTLLFVADEPDTVAKALGALRLELGERFDLIDRSRHDIVWIVEFPMFEHDQASRTAPARATQAHIAVIGHITQTELRRHTSTIELANGYLNRILSIAYRRQRLLPEGGHHDPLHDTDLTRLLAATLKHAQTAGQIRLDPAARERWHDAYRQLARPLPGVLGQIAARAEAHTIQLALICALADGQQRISPWHLAAALALHDYTARSASWALAGATGEPLAEQIHAALTANPAGLTRSQISNTLKHNQPAGQIDHALRALQATGRATITQLATCGRPAQPWAATPAP